MSWHFANQVQEVEVINPSDDMYKELIMQQDSNNLKSLQIEQLRIEKKEIENCVDDSIFNNETEFIDECFE